MFYKGSNISFMCHCLLFNRSYLLTNMLKLQKEIRQKIKMVKNRSSLIIFVVVFILFIYQSYNKNNKFEILKLNLTKTETAGGNQNENIYVRIFDYLEDDVAKVYSSLQPGGQKRFMVESQHTAIIVPYRDRPFHLSAFLRHLHFFLRNQPINYGIFIVEQKQNQTFNRGKLMNVGFLEALKDGPWNCFIFHDVDLLPENLSNIYSCKEKPTHFSSAIDIFNYSVPYEKIFGGVTAMFRSQFEKLNGFSNEFWGWGGEDDEIFMRIEAHKEKIDRLSSEIGRYKMFRHIRDKGNEVFKCRYKRINETYYRFHLDGLNSIKYELLQKQRKHLHTHFLVDLLEVKSKTSSSFSC